MKPLQPIEIVLIVLLSFGILTGCMGITCALLPASPRPDPYAPVMSGVPMLPICASPLTIGIGGLALLWLRRKYDLTWPLLIAAMALCGLGIVFLSLGVALPFVGESPQTAQDFGYSAILCLTPGLFFMIAGLLVLVYDLRRSRPQAAVSFSPLPVEPPPPPRSVAPLPVEPFVEPSEPISVVVSPSEAAPLERASRAAEYKARIADQIKAKRTLAFAVTPVLSRLNQWETNVRELEEHLARLPGGSVSDLVSRAEQSLAASLDAMRDLDTQLEAFKVGEIDNRQANRLMSYIEEQANQLGELVTEIQTALQ